MGEEKKKEWGTTEFMAGEFYGIELDQHDPKAGNGEFSGKQYFLCRPGHGVFVRRSNIVEKLSNSQPKVTSKKQIVATAFHKNY